MNTVNAPKIEISNEEKLEILERYLPQIEQYLRKRFRTLNEQDREDILQEIRLRLLKVVLDPNRCIPGLLITMAKNVAIDILKKRIHPFINEETAMPTSKMRRSSRTDGITKVPIAWKNIDLENREAIVECLNRLGNLSGLTVQMIDKCIDSTNITIPPNALACILFIQGYKIADIANVLGCNRKGIQTLIREFKKSILDAYPHASIN